MYFSRLEGKLEASISVTKEQPCIHLRGTKYAEYLDATETRSFGGIAPKHFARLSRQLLPYKPFAPLKDGGDPDLPDDFELREVPFLNDPTSNAEEDVNLATSMAKWTTHEYNKVAFVLEAWSRWKVNISQRYIASTHCEIKTTNPNFVCDQCQSVAEDDSFKRAVRRVCHLSHSHINFQLLVLTSLYSTIGLQTCHLKKSTSGLFDNFSTGTLARSWLLEDSNSDRRRSFLRTRLFLTSITFSTRVHDTIPS